MLLIPGVSLNTVAWGEVYYNRSVQAALAGEVTNEN